MNNRKHNATNPYQGKARRVLCVCSAGLLRSPTMANLLRSEFGYNTRAVGSDPSFALIPIDEVLVHWAEEIIFVEKENYHQCLANGLSFEDKEVRVLALPDCYGYGDAALEAHIIDQYTNSGVHNETTE